MHIKNPVDALVLALRLLALMKVLHNVPSDFGPTFQANPKCPCYNCYVTLPKDNSLSQYEYDHLVLYIKGLIMQVTL